MRFKFIEEHRRQYRLETLCRVLEVSRSGYYAWRGRPKSERAERDEVLSTTIREAHDKSRATYGAPRVHAELRARGERVGRKRVARLMRAAGLRGKCKRKFRVTTDSNHKQPIAANVLARQFNASRPNEAWAADITYMRGVRIARQEGASLSWGC